MGTLEIQGTLMFAFRKPCFSQVSKRNVLNDTLGPPNFLPGKVHQYFYSLLPKGLGIEIWVICGLA